MDNLCLCDWWQKRTTVADGSMTFPSLTGRTLWEEWIIWYQGVKRDERLRAWKRETEDSSQTELKPVNASIEELTQAYSGFCQVNLSEPQMAATVWRWGVSREFYLLCLGNANSNHAGISNIQASQIPCLNPPPSCQGVFPSTKRLYLSATCSCVVVRQGTNPQ